MATDQVLNWIGGATTIEGQEPLKLSKQIDSFEADFADGHLFGQILCQYGICESINTFSKKGNKEAKVHNFYQIEDALRYLKVNFDAKLSHQIMNEERGASLRLLYQLKLSLDKHFSQSDMSVTNLKKKVVDQRFKKVKDLEHKLPEIHKQHGVEGPTFNKFTHKPLIETEKKLLKYEVARAKLEKKAHDDNLSEVNMLKSIQQSKRQEAINKLKENQTFMKEWQAEGKKNWKKNRETRANEIARMLSFEDREVQMYKEVLNRQLVIHTNEMNNGISDFQENMRKLGIEENISIQEAIKRQEEKAGIPPGQIQNFSYAATMNKIKDTKNNNEFAGKERERRNRKMQVDQRRIQETLDAKKEEENLIIRLMNQQAKEKDAAYLRWRKDNCEKIVRANMYKECLSKEVAKNYKTLKIQEDMKKAAIAIEPQRKADKVKKDAEYKQIRRNQKLQKRSLNIEIASEIVDLIMDVADEAFDFQEQHADKEGDDKLLTKAIWRDWMDIFTKGKKVSEQNLVINEDDEPSGKAKDSMAMLMGGSQNQAVQPFKLLNEVKHEPIYEDLLQYISMSGPLNLRLVASQKWNKFKDIIGNDKNLASRGIDVGFLDEVNIPQNAELGQYIEKLYKPNQDDLTIINPLSQRNTDRSSAMKSHGPEDKVFKPDFPTYHPIKICIIGKASSGKKTQTQMLIDKFGADKLTLFNMNDIIREAFTYVDSALKSAKSDEQADPKAKKGKDKGDAPSDIFAGKDTTKYKEIGSILLSQVQLTTGDKDTIPGKDVDLVSLISDDNLLAQLFVQKLKLTFSEEGPTKESQEAEMRELVEKEKELLQQLEEAKNSDGVEVDAKAKGKGGGKAAKTPEEIQEEIVKLIAADTSGWILQDFPRSINQAKQLELLFQGFELLTDAQKSQELMNFETWTKFSDPVSMSTEGFTGEITAQPSLFDKVFILQTSKEECFRRSTNRKQDPGTSTIYHEEDSPPPDDPKVVEKLVPYFGNYSSEEEMIQKLDSNHIQASENEPALTSFMGMFGNLDEVSGKGITTLEELTVAEKKSKEDVFEKIENAMTEVFAFKQIARDREFALLKEKIQKEEQERLEAEAKAAAEEAAAQEAKEQEEANEANKEEEQEKEEEQQEQADKMPEAEVNDALKTIASKASLHSKQSKAPLSHSKMSSGGMASKKQRRVEYTRDYKISLWEEMETTYIRDGMMTLSDLKRQKESVTDSLNACQRQFIQFLERPDQKQEKINEFVSSFNKFSLEFPDLRKDDQTKDELINRLEQLSNSMWDIIETRKNESIEQISKMSQGGWSDSEMRSLCRNMASMIEVEIKKFETVYKIQMMQDPPIELDAEIMMKKLIDRGGKTYDDKTQTSPVLEQVIASLLVKLDDLVYKNPIIKQIINDAQGKILVKEMNIFIYRLALIHSWALVVLEEIFVNSRLVYAQLDDWIVDAVEQENATSQQVLGTLREAIQSEQIKIEEYHTTLQNLSLIQRIQTQHFSGNEVPLYLQNVHIPTDEVESTRFSVQQLRQIYIEMRCFVGSKGSINTLDQQTFINLMVVAFRQGRVPLVWKYLDFNQISQICQKFSILPLMGQNPGQNDSPKMYQQKSGLNQSMQGASQRQWVNWQTILTHFSLLTSVIPTEKDLAQLRVKLTDAGSNQFVTKAQFKATPFWFDSFEGKPDAALEAKWQAEKKSRSLTDSDYDSEEEDMDGNTTQSSRKQLDTDRIQEIKDILFDIHRVQTGEDKLDIPGFINFFIQISSANENCRTFSEALFGQN